MAAGAGDFEGAFGVFLAADVLEVDRVDNLLVDAECGRVLAGDLLAPRQMGHDFIEMRDRIDVDALDERGFGGVGLGYEQTPEAALLGHGRHRQRAVHGAHGTIQPQFTDDQCVIQFGQHLAGGGHDAERDWQIVGGALFAQVRRGQVDCQAVLGKEVAAVGDCGTHAFAALAHSCIGQADDGQPLQAACDVDFYIDLFGIQADYRATLHFGKH